MRRRLGQGVAALRSFGAFDQILLDERAHDVFQVLEGNFFVFRDFFKGDGFNAVSVCQIKKDAQRIPTLCGDKHRASLLECRLGT